MKAMNVEEMKRVVDEAAYEVDDFAKYRELRTTDVAASVKKLVEVVAALVVREEERERAAIESGR